MFIIREKQKKDLKNIKNKIVDDEITGVNVTVPFKKLIIPFLDKSFTAKKTESVNTLFKIKNRVVGYNTDEPGFAQTMWELFPDKDSNMLSPLKGKNIFVLGAGGVTSSIIFALKRWRAKIFLSNRTKKKAEELKKKYTEIKVLDWGKRPSVCDIVINTTSIGLTSKERIDIDIMIKIFIKTSCFMI